MLKKSHVGCVSETEERRVLGCYLSRCRAKKIYSVNIVTNNDKKYQLAIGWFKYDDLRPIIVIVFIFELFLRNIYIYTG